MFPVDASNVRHLAQVWCKRFFLGGRMLRISKLTDYGTLILSQLAATPERTLSASELAARLRLGQPTVSKVLKALARSELVKAIRGARGGYILSRPASQINLAQIVDALEEQPFGLTECSATSGVCNLEPDCQIRVNWLRVNAVVRRSLQDISLSDMVQPARVSQVAPLVQPSTAAISQSAITWSSGK